MTTHILSSVSEYVEALGVPADHPADVAERVRAFDRAALRVYLSACSEEEECAGWSEWCIQDLWRRACDPGESGDRIETIRMLCERAQGWWHWPRGARGPEFVALNEWEKTTGLRLARRTR